MSVGSAVGGRVGGGELSALKRINMFSQVMHLVEERDRRVGVGEPACGCV